MGIVITKNKKYTRVPLNDTINSSSISYQDGVCLVPVKLSQYNGNKVSTSSSENRNVITRNAKEVFETIV